jgi:hypothetical protein
MDQHRTTTVRAKKKAKKDKKNADINEGYDGRATEEATGEEAGPVDNFEKERGTGGKTKFQ